MFKFFNVRKAEGAMQMVHLVIDFPGGDIHEVTNYSHGIGRADRLEKGMAQGGNPFQEGGLFRLTFLIGMAFKGG